MTTKSTTLYTNRGRSVLATSISNSAVTLHLDSATIGTLPVPGFGECAYVTLDDGVKVELVKYTGVSGDNLVGCVRGQEGTTAQAFTAMATKVENRVTAGNLQAMARLQDRVAPVVGLTNLSLATSSDGNSYLTEELDDGGQPYLVVKNDLGWSVVGFTDVLIAPRTATAITTTTVQNDSTRGFKLGDFGVVPDALILFLTGNNAGAVRKISAVSSTAITWVTPLTNSSVSVSDTYCVVAKPTAVMADGWDIEELPLNPSSVTTRSFRTSSFGRDNNRLHVVNAGTQWAVPDYSARVRIAAVTSGDATSVTWPLLGGSDPCMWDTGSKAYMIRVLFADGTVDLRFVTAFTDNSVTVGVAFHAVPTVGDTVNILYAAGTLARAAKEAHDNIVDLPNRYLSIQTGGGGGDVDGLTRFRDSAYNGAIYDNVAVRRTPIRTVSGVGTTIPTAADVAKLVRVQGTLTIPAGVFASGEFFYVRNDGSSSADTLTVQGASTVSVISQFDGTSGPLTVLAGALTTIRCIDATFGGGGLFSVEDYGSARSRMFPIGTVLIRDDNVNPSTYLLGTWTLSFQGRVLVGVNPAGGTFVTVSTEGGSETHTLTVPELPSHTHGPISVKNANCINGNNLGGTSNGMVFGDSNGSSDANIPTVAGVDAVAGPTGGDTPFSIMPPYHVVSWWKRTA